MKTELSGVVRRPAWSKHVCVWIGTEAALKKALEDEKQQVLDLLDLFPPGEDVPTDDAARSRLLEERLDKELQNLKKSVPGRSVLVVRNAALLGRYRANLKPFYDWYGSDKKMAILVLASESQFQLPLHLQKDVKCDGGATTYYLTSCLDNARLVFREKPLCPLN